MHASSETVRTVAKPAIVAKMVQPMAPFVGPNDPAPFVRVRLTSLTPGTKCAAYAPEPCAPIPSPHLVHSTTSPWAEGAGFPARSCSESYAWFKCICASSRAEGAFLQCRSSPFGNRLVHQPLTGNIFPFQPPRRAYALDAFHLYPKFPHRRAAVFVVGSLPSRRLASRV